MEITNSNPPVPPDPAVVDPATTTITGKGDLNLDEGNTSGQTTSPTGVTNADSANNAEIVPQNRPPQKLDPSTTPAGQYLAGLYDQLQRLQDPVQRFMDYLSNPPDFLNPSPVDNPPYVEPTPLQSLPLRSVLLPDYQPPVQDNNTPSDNVIAALQTNLDATQSLFQSMTNLLEQQNLRIQQLTARVEDLESRVQDSLNK